MNKELRKLIHYTTEIVFALFALSLLSCGETHHNANKIVVTVTIEPMRFFVEEIAGDKVSVQTFVPQGSNPETYEPTAKQMMQLSESSIYFKVGELGFERSWMKRMEENAPNTIFVNTSKGIGLEQGSDGHFDPHVWMSVKNVRKMAKNILDALISIDKKDSTLFVGNCSRFLTRLDSLDVNIRKACSGGSHAFLVYHPMLTYYAKDYGLRQISLEQRGYEPSAKQLMQIIAEARQEHVHTFFMQKEFSNRNIGTVTSSMNVTVYTIDPLGYNWDICMQDIAKKLK